MLDDGREQTIDSSRESLSKESQDITSKLIREEAIKVWELCKQLGMSSQQNKEELIRSLVMSELMESRVKDGDKGSNQEVIQ